MTILKGGDIEAFIARPDARRPVALVYGADAGLVSERAEAIVRASVDDPRDAMAVTRIAGDELASDPARLVDEAQAIPMFGGRRALWIKTGPRSLIPAIEAVLAAPAAAECRIVIEAGDLKRASPLRTLCERAGSVAVIPCYPDDARALERLVEEETRQAGMTIRADARAVLLPLLGGDRRASRNELRKLILYAHGQDQITVDDVVAVIGDTSALALESLTDAAFARKPREVELHFSKAVGAGSQPGAILGAALRQLSQLHKMRLAVESGASVSDAVGGQIYNFQRKALWEGALKLWSANDLGNAMTALAAAALRIRKTPALGESFARTALLELARRQSVMPVR